MSGSRHILEWSLFALIAMLFCLVLAFRPIPQENSPNDTVRYVLDLHRYCTGTVEKGLVNKDVSYNLFYVVTSPACFLGNDGVFLFEVAAFVPLMFLLFSNWRNGTFLWSSSLMFSVIGLELMTNAMRQSLAMFFFFGALALLHSHRALAILLGLIAVAAHTSVLAFFPLLLWISGARLTKKTMLVGGAILLLLGIALLLVFYAPIAEFFRALDDLRTTFSLIYADELKPSFMLFMVLPLYWIYGLRYFFEKAHITGEEKKGLVYSTSLLIVSYVVFPLITYRFAIFAVALQIFLTTRSERSGLMAGSYALSGMLGHLFVMLTISNHFEVLIYG
ncbi:MAG: EpsG family protein [Sideroxydans sp.]|nr:EpsG family protein [Sideroxydans sp.]